MPNLPVLSQGEKKPLFVIVGIVLSCWVLLALWEASPYSNYLHHQSLADAAIQQVPLLTVVFSGGWLLMIGAMMVPNSLPLILEFKKAARSHLKILLFGTGFISVWLVVGVGLFFSDFWLHRAVDASPFLSGNAYIIPVVTLVACGGYQFTKFKRSSLAKCRTTRSSVQAECLECSTAQEALRFGLRHGYFSIGMCGTFMLLMFAVDIGTLWSMLLVGGAMFAERFASPVDKLVNRIGFGLIGTGAAFAFISIVHL